MRIADLFKADADQLKTLIKGYSYTDEETSAAIEAIYKNYKYVACPHTAIAWRALKDYQENNAEVTGIFLSTAHPCKFPDAYSKEIAAKIDQPDQVKELQAKEKQSVELGKDFDGFKDYLLKNA